jgi:hypothetical protein
MSKQNYDNYLSKTMYQKFENCTLIKRYKIISNTNIKNIAKVNIIKDENGKIIYRVKYVPG